MKFILSNPTASVATTLIGLFSLHSIVAQPNDEIIEEVVTVSHRSQSLLDVVGNVAMLDGEELQRISATHIQDALLRMPGVNLHQGNGQEYLPSIRSPVLTGPGACGAFLTAQDNIPLRAAGFCNVNELFEALTEQADRIEVIRGPSNALYGSNALHGVINVLLPSPPGDFSSSIGFEAGPHDYRRTKVFTGNTVGAHGFLINGNATHDGGFRDDAYLDQQKLQLRHDFHGDGMRAATTLTATNLNQETAGYITGFESYEDDDLIKNNPNPEAYRDARSFRLYSRMEWDLSGGQLFTVTPYWRKTEMDFLQHFLPGDPLEENGQDSLGAILNWYSDTSSSFEWIAGIDFEVTNSFLKETQTIPSFGPFPQGKHYDYKVDALQVAAYIQTQWDLSDSWILSTGLRAEQMSYDYDNRMLTGRTSENGTLCNAPCRFSRPADRSDDFTNVSPKLGLLYRINENLSAFFDVALGYRAPQATELYRLQGSQQVTDLDSEEITSVEAGIRSVGDNLRYELSIYQMDKKNVIFRDSSLFNLSDGETEHFGLEMDFGYRINEHWDAALVANYADHTYSNNSFSGGVNINGNQVDTAPKQFGSAQLGWQLPGIARVELEWVHMGEYFTDPENEHKYKGHDLFNLRANWDLNPQWGLALRILNLADENYAERADFVVIQNTPIDRYFPGEPRSAYLEVTFRQ